MEQKLPLRTKLGFGICDLGGNLFFTIMGFYLLYFMTDVVKLAAGLAGTALFVGKMWDAVTDPAVGTISDRTVTRWGRRRPFMFVGAIFLFLFMIVMFVNPHLRSQASLFVWVAIAYCLLNTAYTLVNIPYGSLTPELTDDFNERTVLNGYRMSSAVVGTLLGAALVLPLVGVMHNPDIGWPFMGGVMGLVMMAAAMTTVFTVREKPNRAPVQPIAVLKSYLEVLRQKPFLQALFPWTLHITGVTVIQGALLYYFRYIYHDEGAFQIALPLLLVSSLVFIPIWVRISRRIGKKLSYNIGMGFFAFIILLFFLLGSHVGIWFAYVVMGFGGIGFATNYVMPWAIIPDVVENDYAENGTRREGVFYGMWTFMSKVGQAFAIALSGWILSGFGYRPEAAQSSLSILGIRLLCGPIPVLFFVGGIVILSFYPITQAYYEKIVAKVRAREGN
jgi:glycoside/pentoside/hexuronide:cation symporter, GPH family